MDQNREILRLKKEIQELRQKNISTQNTSYHKNINSLYNNNIWRNSNELNNKNNFMIQSQKGKINNNIYKNHYRNFYLKAPFKQGLFSYKTSLNNTDNNTIINKKNKTNSTNSSLILSSNIQLNFDEDDGNNNFNNISINKSISTIDLNKYKINVNNNNSKNSNLINPNASNTTITSLNNKNIKGNNNIQSIEMLKFSPIQSKTKNCISNSLIIIDNDMTSQSFIKQDETNKIATKYMRKFIEDETYFKNKKKYEKESRRMCIEYIKILMKDKNKSISNIFLENHFSQKILQQTKLNNNNNNNNINNNNNLNTSYKINKYPNLFENPSNIIPPTLTNSINYNKRANLKTISNFVKDMKQNENKDKIDMIKFLCIPRKLKMIIQNNSYDFLFILCPNKLSYLNGIESYIFKWMDLKTEKYVGGFDLIKVNHCSINNNSPNKFSIETFDGNNIRNYDIDCTSLNLCYCYVKYINYLSQLEKCKLFNNNYLKEYKI